MIPSSNFSPNPKRLPNILSNAPTYFAEHADYYEIVREFDGVVFSAPVRMAKPDARIYRYLFEHFDLKPETCFFLDDKPANLEAGRAAGWTGSSLPEMWKQ